MSNRYEVEPLHNEEHGSGTSPHSSGDEEHQQEDGTDTRKKDKYALDEPHPIVGLMIFTVLQIIALVLMVISTPLELFAIDNSGKAQLQILDIDASKKLCVTAWGMKAGCRANGYYSTNFAGVFCYRVRVNFRVIQAFDLMTIFFMVVAFCLAIPSIKQKVGRAPVGALAAFAMVLCSIPWGIAAGMYSQNPCCDPPPLNPTVNAFPNSCKLANGAPMFAFKSLGKYGAGFGILVAAWCVQVIATVFCFLPF